MHIRTTAYGRANTVGDSYLDKFVNFPKYLILQINSDKENLVEFNDQGCTLTHYFIVVPLTSTAV